MNALVAKAFVVHNGAILVLRRALTDEYAPGRLDYPGGGIDVHRGETPEDGLVREIYEECGLTVEPGQLRLIRVPGLTSNTPGVDKRMYITAVSDPVVRLSHEHDAYEWLSPHEVLQRYEHPFYSPVLRYARSLGLI